jgi:hydrogenase nickel incorporation protein HypA/HybF
MHELSLAKGIIEIIQQNIPAAELLKVRLVTVRIGAMSGVVPESLEFSYQSLTAETQLANSLLRFDRIPFRIQCNRCQAETENDNGIAVCEQCWSSDTTILSGNELDVVTIELADPAKEFA